MKGIYQIKGIYQMKVVGIITEYNPFHNGHKHHIDMAKEITGADYVVAVMSGNFVQRGFPALMDKYARTWMALNNGLDLVFELPVSYATGSAEYFALGAVTLLDKLGIVDYLCFGSESGDIKVLEDTAKLLYDPNNNLQDLLYSYIQDGLSYPAAREKAVSSLLDAKEDTTKANILQAISEPNNILGIEYIKALNRINSSIMPVTIKRKDAHYHDEDVQNLDSTKDLLTNELDIVISSATSIRNIIEQVNDLTNLSLVKDSVPHNVYNHLIKSYNNTFPITINDFESIIKYKLLLESSHELAGYLDLSSDMADRIKNIDINSINIMDLAQSIKTKNITLTRVNRALIHALLNIKSNDFLQFTKDETIYYARLLGMKKEASHLIRRIKNSERLPVITSVARAPKQLSGLGLNMIKQDIFATHLYNQALYKKYKANIPNEYKHSICIL